MPAQQWAHSYNSGTEPRERGGRAHPPAAQNLEDPDLQCPLQYGCINKILGGRVGGHISVPSTLGAKPPGFSFHLSRGENLDTWVVIAEQPACSKDLPSYLRVSCTYVHNFTLWSSWLHVRRQQDSKGDRMVIEITRLSRGLKADGIEKELEGIKL